MLGGPGVAALLPYVQAPALPARLRGAARAAKLDVDALRATAATSVEVPEPELVKLRRVSWGGVLRTGLLLLAAGTILPAIAGLDFETLWDAMQDAIVGFLIAGFIVAQLPRVAQAVSTLGSVPARLPFGPVYVMQLATSFLNIALPSARGTDDAQRPLLPAAGLAPATAVASGLIDSLVGNVIQAVLLVGLLLFSPASLDLPADDVVVRRGDGRTGSSSSSSRR